MIYDEHNCALNHPVMCQDCADKLKSENAELRQCLADAVRSALEIREMLDPGGNLSIKDAIDAIKAKWPNASS